MSWQVFFHFQTVDRTDLTETLIVFDIVLEPRPALNFSRQLEETGERQATFSIACLLSSLAFIRAAGLQK